MMPIVMAIFLGASGLTTMSLSMPGLKTDVSFDGKRVSEAKVRPLALRLAHEIEDDFCGRKGHECQLDTRLALSIDLSTDWCMADIWTPSDKSEAGTSDRKLVNDHQSYICYFDANHEMHAAPGTQEAPPIAP